jgi:hypothetical protein
VPQLTLIPHSEVESNLSAIHNLLSASGSGASNANALREELRGTLSLLEADIEDLEESVRVVEEMGDKWGIEEREVVKRRGFVQRVKGEVIVSLSTCLLAGHAGLCSLRLEASSSIDAGLE